MAGVVRYVAFNIGAVNLAMQAPHLANHFLKLVFPDLQALPHADCVLHFKEAVEFVDEILFPQFASPLIRMP